MSFTERRNPIGAFGVEACQEGPMNLLDTLGLTPMGALLWAAAGLIAACAWGAWSFTRRSRTDSRIGLGLEDR